MRKVNNMFDSTKILREDMKTTLIAISKLRDRVTELEDKNEINEQVNKNLIKLLLNGADGVQGKSLEINESEETENALSEIAPLLGVATGGHKGEYMVVSSTLNRPILIRDKEIFFHSYNRAYAALLGIQANLIDDLKPVVVKVI